MIGICSIDFVIADCSYFFPRLMTRFPPLLGPLLNPLLLNPLLLNPLLNPLLLNLPGLLSTGLNTGPGLATTMGAPPTRPFSSVQFCASKREEAKLGLSKNCESRK